MFELLTRILLWLLIGTILWYVFSQFIPRNYLTWLGGILIFIFVILAFLDPANSTVSSVWGLLSLPLKPLGLAIFLLLIALKDGTKKAAGNQVLAALLVLLFSSTPIVADWLTSQAIRTTMSAIPDQQTLAPSAQTTRAIVVLAPQLPNGGSAARLYQEQVAQGNPDIVVIASTGGQVNVDPNVPGQIDPAQAVQSALIGAGVPADRILIETSGVDIYSSVVEVDRLLQTRGFREEVDTVIAIAPMLNMRRAVSTLASAGIRATPEAADRFMFQIGNGDRLLANIGYLVPNVEALRVTTAVVDEYLTSVYYFLRGWLIAPR